MSEEKISKRRRIADDGLVTSPGDFLSTFLPTPGETFPGEESAYGVENLDPFLSPATASSWPFDEFAHDPDYLASQEALRSLLFTTARSAAPSRAETPVEDEEAAGTFDIKQILVNGRRVQYLKNYMSQVAPWVSSHT